MIGGSPRRLEDPPLLRGQGRFADDVDLPGQLHMRVVRSPVAHGVVRSVDFSRARRLEGVVAVWSASDVANIPLIGFRLTALESLLPYRQPVLARGMVRYVGEPVAVVFARDPYVAEDAAQLVQLDIDAREAVVAVDGPPVPWTSEADPDLQGLTSEPHVLEMGYGDVDAALTSATHTVQIEVRVGRHTGVPLECRGSLAHLDPASGQLIIDGAAKVPYWNRDAIAEMVGLAPGRVTLREGHVGGGFGTRGELYPEDVLVALAAVRFRTPVKWIEDRQEHLVAANHSRDQRHVLRAAVDESGVVLALDAEFHLDQGAYVRTHGATVGSLTASMMPGPYVIPAYRVRGHIRLSNKTPAGTYRSPGRYEGTFARERLMDRIAQELGLDPVVVRERNLIGVEQMPFTRDMTALGTPLTYDSGDYKLLLDKLHDAFDLDSVQARVAERRAAGELVGVGFGFFVEKSGFGPFEGVRLQVDAAGGVTVFTGVSSVGQGVETVLAQVVAGILGVDMADISIVRGQTDRFEYGRGAFATRLSVMAGTAVHMAAQALRSKALDIAGDHLGVPREDLELVDGVVQATSQADARMTLGEVAAAAEPGEAHRRGHAPGLSAEEWFHNEHMSYPYGIHVAIVCVDRGTGAVDVERYLVGYDVGRALNPQLVEGQIVGGVAQGLGGALLEDFGYSAEGQPTSTSFMDYLLPTVAEVPPVEVLVTEDAPSPGNPLGVKGAGEGGVNAVAAAVAAAVDDALQLGVVIDSVPILPQRIRALLRSTEGASGPSQQPDANQDQRRTNENR